MVIPAVNELPNLKELIPALLGLPLEPCVIVVDDNSPDGTSAFLQDYASRESRLSPLLRPAKMGYGSAVLDGFRRAKELGVRRVVTMDADFSHDPESVPALVAGLENADITIGSRYVGGVRVLNWHVSRLLLSLFANQYAKTILGLPSKDVTSGFRAYRIEAIDTLFQTKIASQGYSFLVEVLYRLHKAGCRISETPIVYTERREGQSKMSRKVIFEAVLRPWLLRFGPRPPAAAQSHSAQ